MSIEKFAPQEFEPSEKQYPYDALIVLGGGLKKIRDKYYPTDYRDSDNFGMLGAGMRMVAAVDLYLNKATKNIVFATGITQKNIEKFGQTVPKESTIYKNKFQFVIDQLKKDKIKKRYL